MYKGEGREPDVACRLLSLVLVYCSKCLLV